MTAELLVRNMYVCLYFYTWWGGGGVLLQQRHFNLFCVFQTELEKSRQELEDLDNALAQQRAVSVKC